LTWAGFTIGVPLLFSGMSIPLHHNALTVLTLVLIWKTPRVFGTPLIGGKYWRITTGLGFSSGFLVSYQDSCSTSPSFPLLSCATESLTTERFWGWTENEREVKMDIEEMVAKLRAGEPLYGRSEMDPYHQEVSASQSRYAQLKFRISPTPPDVAGIEEVRALTA